MHGERVLHFGSVGCFGGGVVAWVMGGVLEVGWRRVQVFGYFIKLAVNHPIQEKTKLNGILSRNC